MNHSKKVEDKYFDALNEVNHLCSMEFPIIFPDSILNDIIYEPGKEYV